MFVVAGLFAIVIAFATISLHAMKAALTNPTKNIEPNRDHKESATNSPACPGAPTANTIYCLPLME